MVCRNVAEIHESRPDKVIGVYPMPTVVRLVRYIVTKWRYTNGPAWSRPGVLARDGRSCAYCDGPATTIDHVLPRSRGGRNTWENTVAACDTCNRRKGHRTPGEWGHPLRIVPKAPSWAAVSSR
jgi:5-methylcytosine-specific restriction endonuclease McrA